MGWVESLQRSIDYIEDHLLDDLSIEDIAKQANVSVYHFHRTFTINGYTYRGISSSQTFNPCCPGAI